MRALQAIAGLGVACLLGYAVVGPVSSAPGAAESIVDAEGNLHVPANYRNHFQFLGTWAIATDSGKGSKQIHSVYASPGAVAQFRKLGHFADGAVLVKEVFDTDTASMTTGTVSREKTLQGWFVLVKESKDTHPDNKLWGDGWAWSWFDAANPNKTTSTDFKKDCEACHVPAKGTDLIYTQGYPILHN